MTNCELLDLAVDVALKAGDEILSVYNSDVDVEISIKDDNSPVTIADMKAHRVIATALEDTGIPIISEEGELPSFEERADWSRFWLIDPLDGTKEFIKRNGDFTVNIALIEDGAPLLGVVYVPVTGALYFAEVGVGAWKYHKAGEHFEVDSYRSLSHELPLEDSCSPYTVLLSRSHMTRETEEWVENLRKEKPELTTKHAGSSLKTCIIAEGNAHIHPRLGNTMEWDTGAAHAIVKAVGKDIIDFDKGTSLTYNTTKLVNPWFIVK